MGDFIIAIFIALVTVMIPIISYSSGNDTPIFGPLLKVQLLSFIIIFAR